MRRVPRAKQSILFVLSVDTEEEFEWGQEFPQQNCSVENIYQIPKFQDFCENLGARPTYLVDYPVASNLESSGILKRIAQIGRAEIGAHLHPWCTPPFEGPNTERESHVVNLPSGLVEKKLDNLMATIEGNIGVIPTVFRTGRWGIDSKVLSIILDKGFLVDSSVYPFYANDYFSCLEAVEVPYWPDLNDPNCAGTQRNIYELPVTAGFNRPGFQKWGRIHQGLASPVFKMLHPIGVAWRTGFLKKIYLSPELSDTKSMLQLVQAAILSGHPVIHMFLHSSSLLPGKNQYVLNEDDTDNLYSRIRKVIEGLQAMVDVRFCTITEAVELLQDGYGGYVPPQT